MLSRPLQSLLLALIHLYRLTLSPFLGRQCRYHPTCSTYGLEAIRAWGPWRGAWLTLKRIARCHPWATGGFDPVPPRDTVPAPIAHASIAPRSPGETLPLRPQTGKPGSSP